MSGLLTCDSICHLECKDLHMKAAHEIWVATALLHGEHPLRRDFSVPEILGRALAENPAAGFSEVLSGYAITDCVAIFPPRAVSCRILTATRHDRRRLFRQGDPCHPDRSAAKTRPDKSELPARYHYLVDWYDREYCRRCIPIAARIPFSDAAGAA